MRFQSELEPGESFLEGGIIAWNTAHGGACGRARASSGSRERRHCCWRMGKNALSLIFKRTVFVLCIVQTSPYLRTCHGHSSACVPRFKMITGWQPFKNIKEYQIDNIL